MPIIDIDESLLDQLVQPYDEIDDQFINIQNDIEMYGDKTIEDREDNEDYDDPVSKILSLDDRLSANIIETNIKTAMDNPIDLYQDRINYVSTFKKKFFSIPESSPIYDKPYMNETASNLKDMILTEFQNRYHCTLTKDSDFYVPEDFLNDLETLYEFVFLRHADNLTNYFIYAINKYKDNIVDKFTGELKKTQSDDVFFNQSLEKFEQGPDVIVLFYTSEIVDYIREMFNSGFDLYSDICQLDPDEYFNNSMLDFLNTYGSTFIFTDEKEAYNDYMRPLDDQSSRNTIINNIKLKYLESTKLKKQE